MAEWMGMFATYLTYENPNLIDPSEEDEPQPIDKLQAAIVDILTLYSSKDEECFLPFLPQFTEKIWNLLVKTSALPKHDILASTTIKFLTSLISKKMHENLFSTEATLQQIVGSIVVPNLAVRESDEEKVSRERNEQQAKRAASETSSKRNELVTASVWCWRVFGTSLKKTHKNMRLVILATVSQRVQVLSV